MISNKKLGIITQYLNENPIVVVGNFNTKIHQAIDSARILERDDPKKYQILRKMANDLNLPQSLNGNCERLVQNLEIIARIANNLREIEKLELKAGSKVLIRNHGKVTRTVSVIFLSGYFRVFNFRFNISPFEVVKVLT